ncbi:MAG: hypothetical protein BWX78_01108 [Firmicutes bacterium ADurb.Bin099]|nr:MAG: hypothetical protein BWX78_01108 [Firmicutes bacterium ADurb.Bin099]
MIKYVFRFDDISWDMNCKNFFELKDFFIKNDIRPIIGVIPNNEDMKLKMQAGEDTISKEEFWEMIRDLQHNHGWGVALHGYNHVYLTDNGGIFGVNDRSEFAGLTYQEQEAKIQGGKKIFEENNVRIDAFMAPAHSLDTNTLKVLSNHDIKFITDGCLAYPYQNNGLIFIPQLWSWPWPFLFGIMTTCFHINSWDSKKTHKLMKWSMRNKSHIINWDSLIDEIENNKLIKRKKIANIVSLPAIKGVMKLLNAMRRKTKK